VTYRGALIGCGFFAKNHMNAWGDVQGASVVAVCDVDAAKANAFADQFGVKAYTDASAMLTEIKPEFVDIVTTVTSHRSLVSLAAQHAKTVICQKPFAATYADGRAMVEACAARNVNLLVHENFRWQKPFRRMRELLAQGVIGTPHFLRLTFRHGFDIYANQPYLAEVEDLALTDIGLHLFDVSRFLCGDVTRVNCETQCLNPHVKGQDAFQALLRFESGATGSVDCSFFSHVSPDPFPQTVAWFEGDKGTIELRAGYALRIHTATGVTEEHCEPSVPAWGEKPWHLVQESVIAFQHHVVDVMAGKAQAQPSGAHNLETLALTLAAIASSKAGAAENMSVMKVAAA
jgi:D-apiose dehydrogenase